MIWCNKDDAAAYVSERAQAVDYLTRLEDAATQICVQNNTLSPVANSPFLQSIFNKATSLQLSVAQSSAPPLLRSCLDPNTLIVMNYSPSVLCNDEQNAANRRAIDVTRQATNKLTAIQSHCNTYDASTYDMTTYQTVVDDYDDFMARVDDYYYVCDPTIRELQTAVDSYWAAYDAAAASARRAFETIYGNARRALAKLSRAYEKVVRSRREFEESGRGGTRAITSAHAAFERQRRRVERFKLVGLGTSYQPKPIFDDLRRLVREELRESTVTELDRLRNEYVERKIPVPKRIEFTQTKSSKKFSFSKLNMGSYTWAVLTDNLLGNIDAIAGDMENENYPVQLNSVYRNPFHPDSSGRSQHQYGTAVDIQVFDFDKSDSGGLRDDEDWKLLRAITDKYSPSYTEPLSQSGPGHVHVDWRAKVKGGQTYLQGNELI